MSYAKRAEISCILSTYSKDIPILSHTWNDFALELRIQKPDHAEEVKSKLRLYCAAQLQGIMIILKWDQGEKIIIS